MNTEREWTFLYFVSDGEAVKIGISNNVDSRVAQLATGNSRKLIPLHTIKFRYSKNAKMVEGFFHWLFQDHQACGGSEWFKLPPEGICFIQRLDSIKALCFVYLFSDEVRQGQMHEEFHELSKEVLEMSSALLRRLTAHA